MDLYFSQDCIGTKSAAEGYACTVYGYERKKDELIETIAGNYSRICCK
jgi:hypothetical protein